MSYRDQLVDDDDVLCLEVFGSAFVATVWHTPEHGIIANLRFGSGRQHTIVRPDFDRMVGHPTVSKVNVVRLSDAGSDQL